MNALDRLLTGTLLRLSPEAAHHTALRALAATAALPGGRTLLRALYAPPDDPVEVAGLHFPNRIGLAAGYDKDAVALAGLDALGFGHVELGTVTPAPQDGNPGVRIVRVPTHGALVNRLGFPSAGMERVATNLARQRADVRAIVGVNLGRNRDTPNDRALDDYAAGLDRLAPLADYVAINVSSPNTSGLRELSAPRVLEELVGALVERRDRLERRVPLFVKLSPDDPSLADAARAVAAAGGDALIVSNTTVTRPVPTDAQGGLSGRPLGDLALRALEMVVSSGLPVIAVGGITTRADVQRRLGAGASLVQVYTALVYTGPGILRAWSPTPD